MLASPRSESCVLLALGKAQVDALFKMQMDDSVEMLDDSVLVPLVEIILGTFEDAGLDAADVEQLWNYAYSAYDSACRGAEPESRFAENKRLMQSFLLGPRRKKRRR